MLDEFRSFELRQFPDEVLLLFDQDHLVRRIYLDGRGHPTVIRIRGWATRLASMRETRSYVDTVGLNDKTGSTGPVIRIATRCTLWSASGV